LPNASAQFANGNVLRIGDVAKPLRDLQVGFEFRVRSESDGDLIPEYWIAFATCPSAIFAGIETAARRI